MRVKELKIITFINIIQRYITGKFFVSLSIRTEFHRSLLNDCKAYIKAICRNQLIFHDLTKDMLLFYTLCCAKSIT